MELSKTHKDEGYKTKNTAVYKTGYFFIDKIHTKM